MNTVTQSDILDWCARIREAWQHAAEDDDLRTVLTTAAADEVHPSRPAWAEKVSIDTVFYPELIVTFTAQQTAGEVTVTAAQTSLVYVDTITDNDVTFIAGDVQTEQICIYVDRDELFTDSARDLVNAVVQLLAKLGTGTPTETLAVVFSETVNSARR